MIIKLTKKKGKGGKSFSFPALPETIQVKTGARYQSYDLIKKGNVKIPKGTETKIVSWNGEFYGASKRTELMHRKRSYVEPKDCIKRLQTWMEAGAVLQLDIPDLSLSMPVTIEAFEYEYYGAYGNVRYNLILAESRTLKLYTEQDTDIRIIIKEKPDTYKIRSGDTLWSIARRLYGDGKKWTKLYEANKKKLEETARKHGFRDSGRGGRIYPGTVLNIP